MNVGELLQFRFDKVCRNNQNPWSIIDYWLISVPSHFIFSSPFIVVILFFLSQLTCLSQVLPIDVTFVPLTLQKRKILHRYVPFLENIFIIISLIAMIVIKYISSWRNTSPRGTRFLPAPLTDRLFNLAFYGVHFTLLVLVIVMVVLLKAHNHDCGHGQLVMVDGQSHKEVFRIDLISRRDCPKAASSGCLTKFRR